MYRTTLPVVGDEFLDREVHLARILAGIQKLRKGAPEWMALLGPRKVGKTSLLLETARQSGDGVVFAILDAFDHVPVTPELFRLLAIRVVDRVFAAELGQSLEATSRPDAYRAALAGSTRFLKLPRDLREQIFTLRETRMTLDVLRNLVQLPERLATALGLHIVVAIDEFQELAELRVGRPGTLVLPLLRSTWQHHRRVAYVISGSARTMLTELVASQRSPFFGHFSILEIPPFDRENAIALLQGGAPPERPIPRAIAEHAFEVFGGNPFYLQLLGEQLAGLPESPLSIDEDAFKEALSRLLFHRTGRLALFFESELARIVGKSAVFLSMLLEISREPKRMNEVQAALQISSAMAANYFARLGDAVTRDEEGRYRLTDPVMALWLQWRAPGGAAVPMSLVGDEGERRAAETLAGLGFELVYQSRASRGAFDLLAIRAGVMLGVQVKRTDLPVRFESTAWKRMEGEAKRLGWLWVIAAVAPEGEVQFLDPRKARRQKGVTLGGAAVIENLLIWIDAAAKTGFKRRDGRG